MKRILAILCCWLIAVHAPAATITGNTSNLGAPGPIGSTTPSSGAFTTLSATGNVTISKLQAVGTGDNAVLYLGSAGSPLATGIANTTLGYQAGMSLLIGNSNTFIGWGAGQSVTGTGGDGNTSGALNTFVGTSAGSSTTTGSDNTFVGQKAGLQNTTGGGNVFIGKASGEALSTSASGVWIGQSAGKFATTTGTQNVVIGSSAGIYVGGTAQGNVLIGGGAGAGTVGVNNTGSLNAALGQSALLALTSGSNNVAVGYEAGFAATTPDGAVFIGYQAGHTSTSARNVLVGRQAGFSLTGGNNVCIGEGAGNNLPAASANFCVIGGDGSGGSARIDNVFFGKGYATASTTAYTINGTGGSGTDIAGGGVNIAGGKGTGAGAAGVVNVQTSPVSGSSATLNTLVNAAQFDATTTAGQTRFLLYDVDNATLERVTVGAADSGGAGFKVLRIPN